MAKKQFGSVRKLPSGRWQARYVSHTGEARTARTPEDRPLTFAAKADALGWLKAREREEYRLSLLAPAPEPEETPDVPTLRSYAAEWVPARRTVKGQPLGPRTREQYERTIRMYLLPVLGDLRLAEIDKRTVKTWFADLEKTAKPAARACAYKRLRSILQAAVEDELIVTNPAQIRGAGRVDRHHEVHLATVEQLSVLTEQMPEQFRALVALGVWTCLRFGEATGLQRGDIDLQTGTVHVRRGVVRVRGEILLRDPKTAAGRRSVSIPPHVRPVVEAHLKLHTGAAADALLFPGEKSGKALHSATLRPHFIKARDAAGLPGFRFHDLRHTGATMAAQTGATIKELMNRLGHSTSATAMIYQHLAAGRDRVIGDKMSELAGWTPKRQAPSKPKRLTARAARAALDSAELVKAASYADTGRWNVELSDGTVLGHVQPAYSGGKRNGWGWALDGSSAPMGQFRTRTDAAVPLMEAWVRVSTQSRAS
jgi:integrase